MYTRSCLDFQAHVHYPKTASPGELVPLHVVLSEKARTILECRPDKLERICLEQGQPLEIIINGESIMLVGYRFKATKDTSTEAEALRYVEILGNYGVRAICAEARLARDERTGATLH